MHSSRECTRSVIFLDFNPVISRHSKMVASQCANWVANSVVGDAIA